MINSRALTDLRPRTQAKAEAFIRECEKAGLPVLIYSTLRDGEAQDAEYAKGRTAPGKVVTNAKGGDSYHQYGVAFDFAPLVDGKPAWGDAERYRKCAVIGKGVGLEWGGDFKTLVDMPHMQDTLGFAIAAYKAGRMTT
jgi:peptidoglycan L-alanyl-D-glutamate endopeptidase CwlK